MCRPRVLVFHPALAPYRLDFFNALARYCELRVAFLHADAIEQPFNQQLLRGSLRVDNRILANGFTFMGRTVRFGLDREIGEFLPDAVVTAEYSPTTLEIAIKRRLLQRPYAHIVWTDDNPASVSEDVALRKVARALTLRMADGVLVVSDETAAMYRDKFHNALDTGVVPIIQSESVFRARLKHAVPVATRHVERHGLQGRRVLLFVGRLAPVKRVDRLLRAFARVRRRVTDATLVIVGDGTDSAALRALAQSLEIEACVVFAGRHEGVALAAWYLIGGLFALPSEYEPFGAVVNEALLAGIPVVCSGQAGARALVVEGQNGTVIDWSRDEVVDEALGEWLSRMPPLRDVPLQVGRSSLMRARLEDAVQTFVRVVESACQRIGRL